MVIRPTDWSSGPLIGHQALSCVIMPSGWSSCPLVGHQAFLLVIRPSDWSSGPLIGHPALLLVIPDPPSFSSSLTNTNYLSLAKCLSFDSFNESHPVTSYRRLIFDNCNNICAAQNIPGVPGEDYPIFVLPPETQFDCNEQIEGEIQSRLVIENAERGKMSGCHHQ